MADSPSRTPQKIRPTQVRGYYNSTLEEDLQQLGGLISGTTLIPDSFTSLDIAVEHNGQVMFLTNQVVVVGETVADIDKAFLSVNGALQDKEDFSVSVYDTDKLRLDWKSTDFELETDDDVTLTFWFVRDNSL